MPENDPHDQTDAAGESTDHGADESAVPSAHGADSADSAAAASTSNTPRADSADLDQSLSKFEQLSQALARLSQATADDAFAAKIRQLTREASDVQDKPDDRPRSEAPTEEIRAPVDTQIETQRPTESGDVPEMAPQMPVEPTSPTQSSDEQLSASEPSEIAPTETVFESADTAELHEAFDPSPLDDIASDSADDGFEMTSEAGWESTDEHAPSDAAPVQAGADDAPGFESEASASSFDVAEPQQSPPEDIGETEEGDSPEAMTTAHQGDEPPIGEQDSFSVADTLHSDHEAISDSPGDDGQEARGRASESGSEEEVVGASMESLDEIEAEAELSPEVPTSETADIEEEATADAVPPAEMFESVAQEPEVPSDVPQVVEQDGAGSNDEQTDDDEGPETFVDTEATPIGADQPEESASDEQDSKAPASGAVTLATDVGDPEPESVRDASATDSPRATFTAAELESQLGELLDSTGGVRPTAPPPVPKASAQAPAAHGLVDDQSAPSAPPGNVDFDWLAKELDELLNPDAQDSASVDQPASPQTDDASIDGAAEQDDPTPELPDQESSPSDESVQTDDPSVSTIPEPDDEPRLQANDSEQAEVVSGLDAQESAAFQEEIAPTEPFDADSSNGDESLGDSEPSGSADENLDDLTAQVGDVADADVQSSPFQANAPEDQAPKTLSDHPLEEVPAESMQTPPPSAIEPTESDDTATSAEDELAEITAQLDQLLDADGDSSPQETPSDVAQEATAVIDTAAPPGEIEAARESIQDVPETEAQAPPPDEGLAEIDKTLADEVKELINGVADSAPDAADDDLGEPAAPAGDSEPQTMLSEAESADSTSSGVLDEASAATDPSGEEAGDDMAEPAALDSETAAESETDLTMDAQEPAEAEAQPEAEASNEFADGPDPESAPEAQVESKPRRQDGAEPKRGSAKDDEDPRPSQTEELKEAAVAAARFARLHGALQRIEPVAVPVLRRVNYPLRYVPQTLRPIVDWIALSLLFWVPIVWAIALLAG
ncbi:MAG: hypothetical protein V3T84_08675 [Phycisphaerales bacterium]